MELSGNAARRPSAAHGTSAPTGTVLAERPRLEMPSAVTGRRAPMPGGARIASRGAATGAGSASGIAGAMLRTAGHFETDVAGRDRAVPTTQE